MIIIYRVSDNSAQNLLEKILIVFKIFLILSITVGIQPPPCLMTEFLRLNKARITLCK